LIGRAGLLDSLQVLLREHRLLMLTGGFSDLSYWLLETFPALGLIG